MEASQGVTLRRSQDQRFIQKPRLPLRHCRCTGWFSFSAGQHQRLPHDMRGLSAPLDPGSELKLRTFHQPHRMSCKTGPDGRTLTWSVAKHTRKSHSCKVPSARFPQPQKTSILVGFIHPHLPSCQEANKGSPETLP